MEWQVLSKWWFGLFADAHTSEWVSGLTGAGGAVLGGIVTIFWTEWFNRRTRRRDLREKVGVGSFAVYQRLNLIYSTAIGIRKHLREGADIARVSNMPFKCLGTVALLRHQGPLHFTIDELWVLTKLESPALINRVTGLDGRFNILSETMARYDELRTRTWDKFTPDNMNGELGSVSMTDEQFREVTPAFTEMDSLLSQAEELADKLAADVFVSLKYLTLSPRKPLGKRFKIHLIDPHGETVTLSAKDAVKSKRWFRPWGEDKNAVAEAEVKSDNLAA